MRIVFLPIHSLLAPYVHSFWYFESREGLPQEDRRVVVPNGRSKIILTLQGPLETVDGAEHSLYAEGRAWLIGPWDRPVVLSSPPGPTRTIGLELLPVGVHRLFRHPFRDLRDRIVDLADVEPLVGSEELALWRDNPPAAKAAELLEALLLRMRAEGAGRHWLVDFVSAELERSKGLISIRELERLTGYTRRSIDMNFRERVGLSPKSLATICRFQTVYRAWATSGGRLFYQEPELDLYADQSHMIREFRRYTGYSPSQYAKEPNEFGRIFYTGRDL